LCVGIPAGGLEALRLHMGISAGGLESPGLHVHD